MYLVNVIDFEINQQAIWQQLLFALVPILFVFAVWMLSWKLFNTNKPNVKFGCKAGLYGCYILFAAALFVLVIPITVSNLVESGTIAPADASIYTAVLISVTFLIWNVIGLACAVAWHCKKAEKKCLRWTV